MQMDFRALYNMSTNTLSPWYNKFLNPCPPLRPLYNMWTARKVYVDMYDGWGIKQGWGGENKLFSSFMRIWHEIWPNLLLMANRKLYMHFWLAPRLWPWMTLICCKFKFSWNSVLLCIFGRPIYKGWHALTFVLAWLSCYSCWKYLAWQFLRCKCKHYGHE